jgi:hypothetical protein
MKNDVNELISKLRSYREKHFELGKRVLEADDSAVYPLDLLIIASINRSLCLIKGFTSLIEQKNFISAAPLLRLQIDNCLRISAGTLVINPHEFAVKIFEGERVSNMKDKNGERMTDKYLSEELSEDYPWITDVYQESSGYIHLSEKHMLNAITTNKARHGLSMKISDEDAFVSDDVYADSIQSFIYATDLLFRYIDGWVFTKDNPEKAAKMQRQKNQE